MEFEVGMAINSRYKGGRRLYAGRVIALEDDPGAISLIVPSLHFSYTSSLITASLMTASLITASLLL